jgi:hypothetical protein
LVANCKTEGDSELFLVSCGVFSNTSNANNPTSTLASGINDTLA